MKWIRIQIAAATSILALAGACKPASMESRRSAVTGGDATVTPPGPLSSERTEAELRAAFAELVEKYRSTAQSSYATTATARSLQSKRKLRTLNIKMRDPLALIAKTAKSIGSANVGAPIRAAGGTIRKQLDDSNILNVEFPDATDERYLAAVIDFLKGDARIEIVEPDFLVKANAVPNDPRFSETWGLSNPSNSVDIKAVSAWDLTTGSRSVIVGIIDSGIDCTHTDLVANCWVNPGESGTDSQGRPKKSNGVDDDSNGYIDDWQGWNFVSNNNKPADDNHHGTHVAGTLGAIGNNATGVTGVNWQVSLVPLKFLDSTGSGYISDAIAAIDYATRLKFFATNNSWGGGGYSTLMAQAIQRANTANSVFVAAAGNEQNDNDAAASYPAAYSFPNVISVAAIDSNGNLGWFSNYGARTVTVAAPGVDILSTLPANNYGKLSGTSMAAPHVTGALALLKSRYPQDTPAIVISRLVESITPRQSLTGRVKTGGSINAYAAMNAGPDVTPPSVPGSIRVSNRTMTSAAMEWTPSGDDGSAGTASSYKVRISTSPISSESDWSKALDVSAVVTVTAAKVTAQLQKMPVGFIGWVSVRAFDEANNASAIPPSVEMKLIPLRSLQMYDGTSLNDLPANTQWTVEEDPIRGKVYSDGVGPYLPNLKKRMTLRDIPIKGAQKLVLQYWTSQSLEDGYDRGDVFASYQGMPESNWRNVDYVTGKSGWQLRTIDLTQHAFDAAAHGVDAIQVHFEMSSDAYVQYDGWLIDDISILINDSAVVLTGIPVSTSNSPNLNIGVTATLYTSKFLQGTTAFADCSLDATYASPVPNTPPTQPLNLIQDATPKKFLCVRASIVGFDGYFNSWSSWSLVSADPVVAATGFPTGISSSKSFTIQVSKIAPGLATTYSTALIKTDPGSMASACKGASLSWSSWTPLAQQSTINVESTTQGVDGFVALCLRGKDDSGTIQSNPSAYGWTADFRGPEVTIGSQPAILNTLTSFDLSISGSPDLASCAATVQAGTVTCPTAWTSYGTCSIAPAKHRVSTTNDGTFTICILGKDVAGNLSLTPKSFVWTRDTIPPRAVLTGAPPVSTKLPAATIQISGTGVSTYRYATGISDSTCTTFSQSIPTTSPLNLSLIPGGDGPRVLCVLGKDEAGNEQTPPTIMRWNQDTTANSLRFTGLPALQSNTASLNVTVNADEAGTYRYAVVSGTSCGAADLSNALRRPTTDKIAYNMPLSDGNYTLCATFTDNAGNDQAMPSTYTWAKDTVAPVAILTNMPPKETTDPSVRAIISGTGMADYQWSLRSGTTSCNAAVYGAFAPVSSVLSINAGLPGIKILCIKGRDLAANVQSSPTFYQWTVKAPPPPVATIISGKPFSPTGNTTWNIVVGGSRVVSWQSALLFSQTADCKTAVKYGAFNGVATALRLSDTATDGFRTLCIRARDDLGTVQTEPTIVRWLKLRGATLADTGGIYGQVSRGAPTGSTENFVLQKTILQNLAENLSVRMCQITVSNGRLANCKTATVTVPVNTASKNFSFAGVTSGQWVIIAIPPPGRGRVEPLAITK